MYLHLFEDELVFDQTTNPANFEYRRNALRCFNETHMISYFVQSCYTMPMSPCEKFMFSVGMDDKVRFLNKYKPMMSGVDLEAPGPSPCHKWITGDLVQGNQVRLNGGRQYMFKSFAETLDQCMRFYR